MALEVFKCENCGARLPPPPTSVKMVVCEFCKNPGLNPFYVEPVAAPAPAPMAVAAPVAAPAPAPTAAPVPTAPVAPAAPAAVAHAPVAQTRPRTADEIARLAQTHLKVFDSLFYAPGIPSSKESGARKSYGAMIPANEPVLALYDSTVFGGADDGFVVTPVRLGWKNIALSPHVITWDALDISTVKVSGEDIKIMGDMIQIGASSELQGRLLQFLHAMAAPVHVAPAPAPARPAPAPAAATMTAIPAPAPAKVAAPTKAPAPEEPSVKPGMKGPSVVAAAAAVVGKGAVTTKGAFTKGGPSAGKGVASKGPITKGSLRSAQDDEDEDEEDDEEAVQSWIDDTLGFAGEYFRQRDSLFFHPNIPKAKVHAARKTHADEMDDEDNVVVLYDSTVFGGADDGFVATPYGLFWKNIGDDPHVVWWEDLDFDDVELDDGTLTIEGDEVQFNDSDKGLARELYRFIEAMTDWAQD